MAPRQPTLSNDAATIYKPDTSAQQFAMWLSTAMQVHSGEPIHVSIQRQYWTALNWPNWQVKCRRLDRHLWRHVRCRDSHSSQTCCGEMAKPQDSVHFTADKRWHLIQSVCCINQQDRKRSGPEIEEGAGSGGIWQNTSNTSQAQGRDPDSVNNDVERWDNDIQANIEWWDDDMQVNVKWRGTEMQAQVVKKLQGLSIDIVRETNGWLNSVQSDTDWAKGS